MLQVAERGNRRLPDPRPATHDAWFSHPRCARRPPAPLRRRKRNLQTRCSFGARPKAARRRADRFPDAAWDVAPGGHPRQLSKKVFTRSAGRLYLVFSRSDAWHRLQTSSEMLMAELLLSERILCSSWQPVQVGASCEPAMTALPWTLCAHSRASLSWHAPQVSAWREK